MVARGNECGGGTHYKGDTSGVMKLFLVSIFMAVCGNSYVIVYTSENLNVKRIKFVASKYTPVNLS